MNTIGFCDSLNDLLKHQGTYIIDNSVNDVRIVGTVALIVMCVICAVGMDWESKAQVKLIDGYRDNTLLFYEINCTDRRVL